MWIQDVQENISNPNIYDTWEICIVAVAPCTEGDELS